VNLIYRYIHMRIFKTHHTHQISTIIRIMRHIIMRIPEVFERVDIVSYPFIIREERAYLYNRKERDLEEIGSLLKLSQFINRQRWRSSLKM